MHSSGLIAVFLAAFPCLAQEARSPVLVELFTSEGCSSCPPADHLLEQIDPHAIVLSEHVDYWNQQGWADPYSSPDLTLRQQAYSRRFHLDSPYTPQMVIDGSAQFTGSDASRASQELSAAAARHKAAVRLARTASGVQISVEDARPGTGIVLAIADDSDESSVTAGENKGHRLRHVAVVRGIKRIGKVERGGSFQKQIALPAKARAQRVIAFLQEGEAGSISGAAILSPEKN